MSYGVHLIPNSPYILRTHSKPGSSRVIEKYLFNNQGGDAAIVNGVVAVSQLLTDHPKLCPTFPVQPENVLKGLIGNCHYLTINGEAVSLSAHDKAEGDANPTFKDSYFSEALLEEPTQCSKGHPLELKRALLWAQQRNNTCPAGDHPIGDLVIDEVLQANIEDYKAVVASRKAKEQAFASTNQKLQEEVSELRKNYEQEKKAKEKLAEQQKLIALQNAMLQQEQLSLGVQIQALFRDADPWMMASAASKVIIKASGKTLIVPIAKLVGTATAKTAGKTVAKAMPFVGLVIGIGAAIYRCRQEQYWRAFFEIVSGAVGCAPVIGTGISIGMDLAIGGYDLYETYQQKRNIPSVTLTLEAAYNGLGIDAAEGTPPTQQEVDQAFRRQTALVHSDTAAEFGEFSQNDLDEPAKFLGLCKSEIYLQRGWKTPPTSSDTSILLLERSKEKDKN